VPLFADLISDIFQLSKYALRTQKRKGSRKMYKDLGDTIVKTVKLMLMSRRVFGGCPKRKVCIFYQNESTTCIYGPYRYCVKYRSIVEPKSKEKMIHEITLKNSCACQTVIC